MATPSRRASLQLDSTEAAQGSSSSSPRHSRSSPNAPPQDMPRLVAASSLLPPQPEVPSHRYPTASRPSPPGTWPVTAGGLDTAQEQAPRNENRLQDDDDWMADIVIPGQPRSVGQAIRRFFSSQGRELRKKASIIFRVISSFAQASFAPLFLTNRGSP